MHAKQLVNEDIQQLIIKMYSDGCALSQICEKCKCHYYDIKKVFTEHGIFYRVKRVKNIEELTDFEINRIHKMYDNGLDLQLMTVISKCSSDILLNILAEKIDKDRIMSQMIEEKNNKKIATGEGQVPIDCDTQGQNCVYKLKLSGCNICDYLCQVGHSRGCEPTECTKYKFRKSRR